MTSPAASAWASAQSLLAAPTSRGVPSSARARSASVRRAPRSASCPGRAPPPANDGAGCCSKPSTPWRSLRRRRWIASQLGTSSGSKVELRQAYSSGKTSSTEPSSSRYCQMHAVMFSAGTNLSTASLRTRRSSCFCSCVSRMISATRRRFVGQCSRTHASDAPPGLKAPVSGLTIVWGTRRTRSDASLEPRAASGKAADSCCDVTLRTTRIAWRRALSAEDDASRSTRASAALAWPATSARSSSIQ
mmetsp:Transcript_29656/g.64960  ORF Transcript_29656/g.64960 Transcript_29656/m.64960 type:complete len:247 (-) Transcript_29656:486-1226(-)